MYNKLHICSKFCSICQYSKMFKWIFTQHIFILSDSLSENCVQIWLYRLQIKEKKMSNVRPVPLVYSHKIAQLVTVGCSFFVHCILIFKSQKQQCTVNYITVMSLNEQSENFHKKLHLPCINIGLLIQSSIMMSS